MNEVRVYRKKQEECMEEDHALLELDYGGTTDSAGKKVGIWSATVVQAGRKQEHYDFFFDMADSKQCKKADTARKDGQTGIHFLKELLEPKVDDGGGGFQMSNMLHCLGTPAMASVRTRCWRRRVHCFRNMATQWSCLRLPQATRGIGRTAVSRI